MATHRVARSARYQGGASFNVFSAQGSNPMGDCKVCGRGVQKLYDKLVKTYVYSLCGGPASKLQLPKDENKSGLQLLQPFLVFQIFVPANQPFALELRVTDTTNTRRKMYFSTSFSDIKSTPLHCQIPITMVTRGIWLSLSIHVADLFAHCFKGAAFKSVDTIVLGPVCKLRKIFTMRNRLSDIGNICNSYHVNNEDYLPQEHMFALGVDNVVQVLDMMALQMTITSVSNSSNGIEEDILKLRKIKLNKLEPHQVHVAFGSRVPLALSTVQINSNLLNGNKSHSSKAFPKERERIDRKNQSVDIQSEIPSSMHEHNRVEPKSDLKSETLQNLLKHANNFNKNHVMMKLKKDQMVLDQDRLSTNNEHFEMSHNVHFTTQELQLPSNMSVADVYKPMQKSTKSKAEGIMALTSLTRDDMMNMLSKEDPTITHLTYSNDEVHKQIPESTPVDSEVVANNETLETNSNKIVSQDPQSFVPKIFEEFKSANSIIGLGKYVRKSSHFDSNRKKEYKQSRYMDSPPESPPCGWTSCTEDDSEGKPLKIPSFFNKLRDDMEEFERSNNSIDTESNNINENSCFIDSSNSDDERQDDSHLMDSSNLEDENNETEEDILKLFDNKDYAQHDYFSKNLCTQQSTSDMEQSSSKNFDSFMERPIGVKLHEKFDLETRDNSAFHDLDLAEDYSFERHSWSSNDYPQREQDGEQLLIIDTRLSKNEDDLEELTTPRNVIRRNGDDSPDDPLRFLKDYINENDSLEIDVAINDDYNDELRSSLIESQPHSRTSYKDTKKSRSNEDAQCERLASSSDSLESISKHSIPSFELNTEQSIEQSLKQEDFKEIEISNCIIEHEDGITINNGRPDEDLDLLYDPTLDCYYDPKTNRYYELK